MAEGFYSVEQLAKLTGESVAVWRKRLARRELPWFKLGANVRVRESDFQEWLQSRMVATKPNGSASHDSI